MSPLPAFGSNIPSSYNDSHVHVQTAGSTRKRDAYVVSSADVVTSRNHVWEKREFCHAEFSLFTTVKSTALSLIPAFSVPTRRSSPLAQLSYFQYNKGLIIGIVRRQNVITVFNPSAFLAYSSAWGNSVI